MRQDAPSVDTASPATRSGTLIEMTYDGALPASGFSLGWTLVLITGAVVVAAPGGMTPVGRIVAACIAAILSAIAIFAIGIEMRARRAINSHELFNRAAHLPLEASIASWWSQLTIGNPGMRGVAVADWMIERGERGRAVRVVRPSDPRLLPPIDKPFEPLPLELAGPLANCDDPTGRAVPTPNPTVAAIRRATRAGRGAVLCFALYCLGRACFDVAFRAMPIHLLLIPLALIAAVWLWPHRERFGEIERWFVVPGGLLRQRAWPWEPGWRSHVFRREDSAILTYAVTGRGSRLAVSDGRERGYAIASQAEVDFALRAWLSPLPPPTDAMLVEPRA